MSDFKPPKLSNCDKDITNVSINETLQNYKNVRFPKWEFAVSASPPVLYNESLKFLPLLLIISFSTYYSSYRKISNSIIL